MIIHRAGQKILTFSPEIEFAQPRVAAAVDWWLSGGISAANCIAAYQPKGAASLAASYVNLNNPGTYNAAPGVAPTWNGTNGWMFNGAQYLATGLPVTDGGSLIIRYSNYVYGDDFDVLAGVYDDTERQYIHAYYTTASQIRVYVASTSTLSGGAHVSSGVIAIGGNNGFFNAANEGAIGGSLAAGNLSPFIGCLNLNGSPGFYSSTYIQAIAWHSIDTASYMSDLTTAIAAL